MEDTFLEKIYRLLEGADLKTDELRELIAKTHELLQDKINQQWRNEYRKFLDEETQELEELLENSQFVEDKDDSDKLSFVEIDDFIIDNEFNGIAINHKTRMARWWADPDAINGKDHIILMAEHWNRVYENGENIYPPRGIMVRYAAFLFRNRR